MMFVPIRALGDAGVIADIPPHDLPPNAFTDARNVRFRDGKLVKSDGWVTDWVLPAGQYGRWFEVWRAGGALRAAVATSTESGTGADVSQLHIWDGNTLSVADPDPPYTLDWTEDWVMTGFGEYMIAHNQSQEPFYIDGAGSKFLSYSDEVANTAPEKGWPEEWVCKGVIRGFKGFLIALNVQVNSGSYGLTTGSYPHTVFWSNLAGLNELPHDWAVDDPASLAGFNDLPEDQPLVDGLALGDSFIVYLKDAAYAMTLTGSNTFVFNFRKLFDRGMLNRNCGVVFDNYHFVVGPEVIYVHDGLRIQRPADDKVERRFYRDIGDPGSVRVSHDSERKEIYITYATAQTNDIADGLVDVPRNDRAMIWNYQHDTWTFEDLPAVCAQVTFRQPAFVTWATVIGDWQSYSGIQWSDINVVEARKSFGFLSTDYTVAGEPTGAFKRFAPIDTRDGNFFPSYAERTFMDLDEVAQTNERFNRSNRLLPQVSGEATIYFRMGSCNVPAAAVNWQAKGQQFVVGTDYKVDYRLDGRYLAYRVGTWSDQSNSATNAPGLWELSGMDLNLSKGYSR